MEYSNLIVNLISRIPPVDQNARDAARQRLDRLTKPQGSLGRLEELVVQLAGITGSAQPDIDPPAIFVFAGDHGVAARGVSAYPSEVTAQMVLNFAGGRAVINALARQIGAGLRVIDVGVAGDHFAHPNVVSRRVRGGTRDWTVEPAMTHREFFEAIAAGAEIVRESDCGIALIGEMGIGNTTTAAAVASALTGNDPKTMVGLGTGIDGEGRRRKIEAVRAGLIRHNALYAGGGDAGDVLASLGGLEIAAMTGAVLAAAALSIPILIDGYIATTAAIAAVRMAPQARDYIIASHCSCEPGHAHLLDALEIDPLLMLDLRLGEASGAALAYPLISAALAVQREVATFDEASVSEKEETE